MNGWNVVTGEGPSVICRRDNSPPSRRPVSHDQVAVGWRTRNRRNRHLARIAIVGGERDRVVLLVLLRGGIEVELIDRAGSQVCDVEIAVGTESQRAGL